MTANKLDAEFKIRSSQKTVNKKDQQWVKYQCRRDGEFISKNTGNRVKLSRMRSVKNIKCKSHITITKNSKGYLLKGCLAHDKEGGCDNNEWAKRVPKAERLRIQGLLEIPVAPKEIWRRYCPSIEGARDIQMADINRIKARYCNKGSGSRTDFDNMCLTLQR